jgi:hypothetical protein
VLAMASLELLPHGETPVRDVTAGSKPAFARPCKEPCNLPLLRLKRRGFCKQTLLLDSSFAYNRFASYCSTQVISICAKLSNFSCDVLVCPQILELVTTTADVSQRMRATHHSVSCRKECSERNSWIPRRSSAAVPHAKRLEPPVWQHRWWSGGSSYATPGHYRT